MTMTDQITVGVSEGASEKLDHLKELGYFAEKMDGYRFGIGLAVAHGVVPPEIVKRTTFVNAGSLDPDQTLKRAVEALMPEQLQDTTPYRLIERLAEWGIHEMHAQEQEGEFDAARILDQLAAKAG